MQEVPRQPERTKVVREQDFSRATYIAAPRNEPAGINMEDFVMQEAASTA